MQSMNRTPRHNGHLEHASHLVRRPLVACLALASLLAVQPVTAQDTGSPPTEVLEGLYPGRAYSPYAQRSFPSQVFWGETHLHTGLSLDAGLFGNTLGHEEAYRLARGEEVVSSTGLPVKLSRPLDWLVITDHSDLMGLATDIQSGAPNLLKDPTTKGYVESFAQGGQTAAEAALDLIGRFSQFELPESVLEYYSPGTTGYKNVWQSIVETAEEFNEPGRFTALIGFEWTSVPQGMNLHRNVVLRDGASRAGQVVPMTTQPPLGSTDPMDLYDWLDDYVERTGGQAFALAHNGNLSNGWMFPIDERYAGTNVNLEYVERRARWEPLYEITQMKGDGEAHPFLSPDDEFADYETWDIGNLDVSEAKTDDMLAGEYGREALKRGLLLEREFGTNPYKFGFVGATDAHTALAAAAEDNYFGKTVAVEPSAERVNHAFMQTAMGTIEGDQLTASGYQGVWATENTREAIFDAMVRKETYGTTGPRMLVRFFGGWEYTEDDLRSRTPAFRGYEKGVPMGGDLTDAPAGAAPTFMLIALKDPIGANLDRVQVVKGWIDDAGETHERVYDVAVSGDRTIDGNGRAREPVGNTVDIEAATWTNTIGTSELATLWTDPDFDPDQPAFYYARVIEIPTPRWVVYDRLRLGAELREGAELIHQERAYTSPIWYSPSN
jgi:hypothetical protein